MSGLSLVVCLVACWICGSSSNNTLRPARPPYRLYDPVQVTMESPSSYQTCNTFSNLRGPWHDCFQGKCWCTKDAANCSFSGLTFIPTLKSGIKFLNFSYNGIQNINGNFFDNVTHLTAIALDGNPIRYVHPNATKKFAKLRVLFYESSNDVSTEVLGQCFGIKTLMCVDLQRGDLKDIHNDTFRSLTDLEQIYLQYNSIGSINLNHFAKLKKLNRLVFDSNVISKISSARLGELEGLSLNDNGLQHFPETCIGGSNQSYFPNMAYLNLQLNKIRSLSSRVCLPRLQILNLCVNNFPHLYKGIFGPRNFPSLQALYLQDMQPHIDSIDEHAFSNPSLQKISLMYNYIQFSLEGSYSALAFAGCPNLTELVISHNALSGLTDERFLALFGSLHNLQRLFIGGSDFPQITTRTFAGFPYLNLLELYLNKISAIPDGAFDHNLQLKDLRLNANRISSITAKTFSTEVRKAFTHLDLSNNPYSCDCDLRWFSDWLRSNDSAFRYPWAEYNCDNDNWTAIINFHVVDQACILDPTTNIYIIAMCSFLIAVGTIFLGLFHCRWQLRLLCFDVFRSHSEVRRQRLLAGNFAYDVFVSYAAEDQRWVRRQLMPELDRMRLRPCIHERDFLPGKNIVENIVDCVESSKKVLMVFSRHFVKSRWCQYELNFCLRHVMEHDDALVVACIDDVVSRDLTSAMVFVMKTITYIQWDDQKEAKASFWGRLRIAFQEVIPISSKRKAAKRRKTSRRTYGTITSSHTMINVI